MYLLRRLIQLSQFLIRFPRGHTIDNCICLLINNVYLFFIQLVTVRLLIYYFLSLIWLCRCRMVLVFCWLQHYTYSIIRNLSFVILVVLLYAGISLLVPKHPSLLKYKLQSLCLTHLNNEPDFTICIYMEASLLIFSFGVIATLGVLYNLIAMNILIIQTRVLSVNVFYWFYFAIYVCFMLFYFCVPQFLPWCAAMLAVRKFDLALNIYQSQRF